MDRIRDAVAHAAEVAGRERPEAALALMRPWLDDVDWLADLAGRWTDLLRDDPLLLPPLGANRAGSLSHLIFAATPPVTLLATRIAGAGERGEPIAPPPDPVVRFSGQACLYRLLSRDPVAGRLAVRHIETNRSRSRAIRLRPNAVFMLDERKRALWLGPQAQPVWLLRVRVVRTPPPPIHGHALDSGVPVRTIQADDGFARAAMLASVLRASGARQAVPILLDMIEETKGSARWTIMRELLALDLPAAWPRLQVMAAQDEDPTVRAAAEATLARHGTALPCPA